MTGRRAFAAPTLAAAAALFVASAACAGDAAGDYARLCAKCHGPGRLGGTGPALLPENLERLRKDAAREVILHGRGATQMPAFSESLDAAAAGALVEFVYTPPPVAPDWTLDDAAASRIVHAGPAEPAAHPVFDADPKNLFVVVETGDHHAALLDGDKLEPIVRFPTRFALHGGPKFSPDGRYVYFASRDGWVSKYDLWRLRLETEIRVGINTRNIAVSSDGRYVLAGNYLPHTLVFLDATDLTPVKVVRVSDRQGKSSRVSAVYDAAPRGSFVVALKDVREVWEIPYAADAAPVYEGLVHDYALGEALPAKGPFPVRRIELSDFLDDFLFDAPYRHLVGASRDGAAAQVVNLDVRRQIASLPLPGLPHLASGITWERGGRTVLGTPNLKQGVVSVVDVASWKPVAEIPTLGPGFFLRGHEASRYLWVDNLNSANKDALQVIDRETLEVVATLRPAPGKAVAHVEFTRDGRYALASLWETDGAVIVYDARTLTEVKRIPMNKPSGKYNVFNKTTRSSGTSH